MKITANGLRIGNLIEHNGKLWRVCKLQHVKPGKGGAYIQAELKEIKNGTKLSERFRSDETLEKVRLDEEEYQLLYKEGDSYTFMNISSFNQISLDKEVIGDSSCFLQDNMIVKITSYEGEIIGIILPESLVMEVIEADAVVKGQTATSSYKPAVLENGVKILVPSHIEAGTKIVVNTSDISYVEKAK
ncbi:MAG: elongation factor P [Holosporaceae bacterium]|jgi:elongation factor P|nr:elongation factor P [Holosporaceae bacterium]